MDLSKYHNKVKNYENFCPHLWQHFSMETNGDIKFCCEAESIGLNASKHSVEEIFNSDVYNQSRQRLLAGEKIPQCKQCWEKEEQGYSSKRLMDYEFVREDFVNTFENWELGKSIQPSYYNLQVSNTCNYACIMCSPVWSSLLHSITVKNEIDRPDRFAGHLYNNRSNIDQNEKLWQSLSEIDHKLNRLYVTGGEPFIIKNLWKYIKSIVDKGHAKNINFWCSTNVSMISDEQLELLSEFKHVNLGLSIDAAGRTNDYLRFGSDWSLIETNLRKLIDFKKQKGNIRISLVPVIHALNITEIDKLIAWYISLCEDDNDMRILPNIIYEPHSMILNSVPTELIHSVKQKINDQISSIPSQDSYSISGWQNIFTALDNHKYSIASNKLLYDDLAYFSKTYKKDYLDYFGKIFK